MPLPPPDQKVENCSSQPCMEVSGTCPPEKLGAFCSMLASTIRTNWLLVESQPKALMGTGIQVSPEPRLTTTYCSLPILGSMITS